MLGPSWQPQILSLLAFGPLHEMELLRKLGLDLVNKGVRTNLRQRMKAMEAAGLVVEMTPVGTWQKTGWKPRGTVPQQVAEPEEKPLRMSSPDNRNGKHGDPTR